MRDDLTFRLQALPAGTPAEAGFDPGVFAAVDTHYQAKVDSGAMAGIVYAVARHGRLAHAAAIGRADIAADRPLALDTVFRAFSMTKPITAVALMMLFEEGRFALDDALGAYLPEFAEMRVLRAPDAAPDDTVPQARPITIRDVLRHTAGFGLGLGLGATGERLLAEADIYAPGETLAEQMTKVAGVPLSTQPGATWSYSLAPDVQARLVEVLSGEGFGAFLDRRVFAPLGMRDTAFAPRPDMVARLTNLYWFDGTKLVAWSRDSQPPLIPPLTRWPSVFAHIDEPELTYERGSFGLYTTLDDFLRFAQMLLGGGRYGAARLLAKETVALMARDHLGDIPMPWDVRGLGFGLGFAVIADPAATGAPGTVGTFYWDGAAGTLFWVDPANDLVVVALVQHLLVSGLDPHALAAELRRLIYPGLAA